MAEPQLPEGYKLVGDNQPSLPEGYSLVNLQPIAPPAAPAAPSTSWADVGANAITNLPSSAWELGKGIVHSVAHPVETGQNLYGIGKGGLSELGAVNKDPEAEAKFNAVKDFYANRYGSMEGFKKSLGEDPAGVLMDLSTVLTGGEAALARLPGVAGRAGEIAGQIGRVANPVNVAMKTLPVAGRAASQVLGLTTGVAPESIQEVARSAYRGSNVATENMRGQVSANDIVDMARSAMDEVKADRAREYKANMASTNANKAPIDYTPIHKAVQDASDSVQFKGKTTDPRAAKAINDIADLVTDWHSSSLTDPDFATAIGLDKLKQAVGGVKDAIPFEQANARRVAGDVYSKIRAQIVKQDPNYANTMLAYSDASDKLNEMSKTLSLNPKATNDTALRKLLSVTRNNANTNYGARAESLDALAKKEPGLPAAISGQAMNSWAPRGILRSGLPLMELGMSGMHGLAGLANPVTLATLPAFSPRLVGEAANAAGRVASYVVPPRAARAAAPVAAQAPRAANAAYVPLAPLMALQDEEDRSLHGRQTLGPNSLPAILPEEQP